MGYPETSVVKYRYGLNTDMVVGISMPQMKQKAKSYRRTHSLAFELWPSGIHEV
jgi:3-methyladenine DNA glycosylase AlkD